MSVGVVVWRVRGEAVKIDYLVAVVEAIVALEGGVWLVVLVLGQVLVWRLGGAQGIGFKLLQGIDGQVVEVWVRKIKLILVVVGGGHGCWICCWWLYLYRRSWSCTCPDASLPAQSHARA